MRRYIVQTSPLFFARSNNSIVCLGVGEIPPFSHNFLMVFPSVHQKMTNDCSQLQISKDVEKVDDEMAISCLAFSYILVKVSIFNTPFVQMSSHVPKCGPCIHPNA